MPTTLHTQVVCYEHLCVNDLPGERIEVSLSVVRGSVVHRVQHRAVFIPVRRRTTAPRPVIMCAILNTVRVGGAPDTFYIYLTEL